MESKRVRKKGLEVEAQGSDLAMISANRGSGTLTEKGSGTLLLAYRCAGTIR